MANRYRPGPYEPLQNQNHGETEEKKGIGMPRGIKEIMQEAESLPVEKRAILVDSLLRTLNPPVAEIDSEWAEVARLRLEGLRSGAVKAVPGGTVLARIKARLKK